jgi:hypothetical protein
MIIALKKDLEVGNTGMTVNHWLVTKVSHNPIGEHVRIEINGYKSRADRVAGKDAIAGAFHRFIIRNDETGNHYNKFNRFVSDKVDAKHKDHFKGAVLEYLQSLPDFADAIED